MRRPEVREEVPEVREVREQVPEVREVSEPAPEAHEMPHFVVRRREVRGRGMPFEIHLAGGGVVFHIDRDCFGLRRAIEGNMNVRTACQVCCREVREERQRWEA